MSHFDWYALSQSGKEDHLACGDEGISGWDLAVFGHVTLLVAPDRKKAWALCQPGWDEDGCLDWDAAMSYLDQYSLADVAVDHLTDWYANLDGSDTYILRAHPWR